MKQHRRMKKAVVTFVVCIGVLFTAKEVKAAQTEVTKGACTYREVGDGTIELVSYNDKEAKKIKLPSKIDGKQITVIGSKAFLKCRAKEIYLPDGVKKVRLKAFSLCREASVIDLPDSVETIGYSAFQFCYNLKEVKIPMSLKKFNPRIVKDMFNLESLKMNGKGTKYSVYDGILYNRNKTKAIYCPEKRTKGVKLNSHTKEVADNAFASTAIKSIRCNDRLSKIGEGAFKGCYAATSIKLNNNLKEIGSFAFYGTDAKEIKIPKSVDKIGNAAFYGRHMEKIVLAKGNNNFILKNGVLYNKDMTQILAYPLADNQKTYRIADTVKELSLGVFSANKTIIIPKSVTRITGMEYFYEGYKICYKDSKNQFLKIESDTSKKGKTLKDLVADSSYKNCFEFNYNK